MGEGYNVFYIRGNWGTTHLLALGLCLHRASPAIAVAGVQFHQRTLKSKLSAGKTKVTQLLSLELNQSSAFQSNPGLSPLKHTPCHTPVLLLVCPIPQNHYPTAIHAAAHKEANQRGWIGSNSIRNIGAGLWEIPIVTQMENLPGKGHFQFPAFEKGSYNHREREKLKPSVNLGSCAKYLQLIVSSVGIRRAVKSRKQKWECLRIIYIVVAHRNASRGPTVLGVVQTSNEDRACPKQVLQDWICTKSTNGNAFMA